MPLHHALQCRVRMTERDGRKIHMTGELTGAPDEESAGERVVYTRARAIFIAIPPEMFSVSAD